MATELPVDMDDEDFPEDDHSNPTAEFVEESQRPGAKIAHTRISRKRTKTGCLSKSALHYFLSDMLTFTSMP
jgi:hypothetical protein